MWCVRYAVEGVRLESQPFKTADDAELWKREVAGTFPSVTDLEVFWQPDNEEDDHVA